MAQQSLRYLDNYNQRIRFLRSQGDELLNSIKMLEIGMNRRKQRNEAVHLYEIDWMYSIVKNLFLMLAEIKTCEYFIISNQLIDLNDDFYKRTSHIFFSDLVRKFNAKLNARRLNANGQIHFSIHS